MGGKLINVKKEVVEQLDILRERLNTSYTGAIEYLLKNLTQNKTQLVNQKFMELEIITGEKYLIELMRVITLRILTNQLDKEKVIEQLKKALECKRELSDEEIIAELSKEIDHPAVRFILGVD